MKPFQSGSGQFSRAVAAAPTAGAALPCGPSASRDEGQRLETAVFDRPRRGAGGMRAGAISRLLVDDGGRHEVDFVVGDAPLGADEGRVVTVDDEEIDVPEGTVHVVPAWRWLLG